MRMRMLLPPWSDLRLLVLPLERQQPRFLSTSGSRSHPGPGKEEKEEEKEEVVISTPSRTLYQDLGLEGSNASSEEIKTAYYQLSKKYHPDLNPGDEEAATEFQRISEANEILGNPKLRRSYDRGTLKKITSVGDRGVVKHRFEGDGFYASREKFRKEFQEGGSSDNFLTGAKMNYFVKSTTTSGFNYKKKRNETGGDDHLAMKIRNHNERRQIGRARKDSGRGVLLVVAAMVAVSYKFFS